MTPRHAQDIFRTSKNKKKQKLYLKNRAVVADEYLIQSKKVEVITQLEQLKQNYSQFWLRLLAPVHIIIHN